MTYNHEKYSHTTLQFGEIVRDPLSIFYKKQPQIPASVVTLDIIHHHINLITV